MAAELRAARVEETELQTRPAPRSIRRRASGWPRSATSDRSRNAPRKPGEPLPDPKDKIDIFNLMTSAHETNGKERIRSRHRPPPSRSSPWIRTSSTPGSCSATSTSGSTIFAAALEQYKRALQIKPDYDLATINLAGAYRALGDYKAAIARLRAVPAEGSEERLGAISARGAVRGPRASWTRRRRRSASR